MDVDIDDEVDMGWQVVDEMPKKRKGKKKASGPEDVTDIKTEEEASVSPANLVQLYISLRAVAQKYRMKLLKELSARLARDRQLRYAERELEMQKLLMGKGGSRKLKGVEKVEDKEDDEDASGDERPAKKVDEKTWKPRVYKWRLERKR